MFSANFPVISNETRLFKNVSISNLSYINVASEPDWVFYTHSHSDHLELSYIFSGQSALYCGDKFYETHPGDLIIKNSNVMHAEKSDVNNPLEQICISINGIHLDDLPKDALICDNDSPVINVGGSKAFYDAIFMYLIKQTVDKMSVDINKINCLMESILEIIYKDFHLNVHKEEHEKTGKDIRPVLKYIEKNYASTITIEGLSKEFFISPFYLSKKFKAETGFTINQYIISCRMGEAERLLIFSNDQIKDIALSCGYDNLPYFYTTFKKYAGCTPAEYKEKYG